MTPQLKRPMLAATIDVAKGDLNKLRYPLIASPKIDGIRCLIVNGEAVSRTLKPIPNKFIKDTLRGLPNFDGELIVGDGKNFQKNTSGIMSREGEPEFKYIVFDWWDKIGGYTYRYQELIEHFEDEESDYIELIDNTKIEDKLDLDICESQNLNYGHEGVMLRSPSSPYKQGRSTLNEQYLLKLKRFEDSEAVIIGFVELEHNANPASVNKLGLTERSTHIDKQIKGGTLGALKVRDVKSGAEFHIGSGFTDRERQIIWSLNQMYLGRTITYKFQRHGMKDKIPRSPVFKGFRYD